MNQLSKCLFLFTGIFSALILFSCENKTVSNSKEVIIDSNMISFSKEIQPLFDKDCSECHDYLENGVSYKMLTTKQSSCRVAPNYIDTVNPTSSYLYVKLHDVPPTGASMKGVHWTAENIQKLLLWIEQGAKNN